MTVRCVVASLFFAISSLLSPAWSTSFSTDQSDLYFILNESGWGIQLVQRGSVIFATMFVYDQSNAPIWYVATMRPVGNTAVWTGDLLLTRGPWFGTVPFDPHAVSFRVVGTMTWTPSTVTTGTLTYSVDGVQVSKNVIRQVLVLDDFSGHYGGAIHQTFTGCFNPASNGTSELFAVLNVTQNLNPDGTTSMSIATSDGSGTVCNFVGTLSQAGQMGSMVGTYSCTIPPSPTIVDSGNVGIFELQVNISGLTGRLATSSMPTGCSTTGYFGAMRGTTF